VWLLRDASWQQHFGPGVLGFDGGHVFASDFFGVDICHVAKLGAFYFLFSKIRIRDIYGFTVAVGLFAV